MTAPAAAATKPSRIPAEPDERVAGVVSALTRTDAPRGNAGSLQAIDPKLIDIGSNVRKVVGDVSELAASIAAQGLLSPVKVLGPFADTKRYSLIYGQRRLTAVLSLKLPTIAAIVVEPGGMGTDAKGRRVIEQLIENLQREDLDALTIAHALRGALDADQKLTQAQIAAAIGKSPAYVSNTLRLLETSPVAQAQVGRDGFTASHLEAIVGLPEKEQLEAIAWTRKGNASSKALEEQVAWARSEKERIAANEATQRNKLDAAVKKLVADLISKGAVKAAPIRVSGYGDDKAVLAGLTKHGYTNATAANRGAWYTVKPGPQFCTCTAWFVQVGYHADIALHTECIVDAHRIAQAKASGNKAEVKRAESDEARDRVMAALQREAALLKAGGLTLRLLVADLMRYQIDAWSETRAKASRKRDRNWYALRDATDEELIAELFKHVRIAAELSPVAIAVDLERYGGQVSLTDAIAAAETTS